MWEMSSTTELGVELAEDPDPRPPNPRPSLIPIPTKYNKYFPVWTPEAIDNIFTAFSSLYAVIVITVFLAFSFTEIVTFPHLHNHLEKSGFFVYLYTISIIFYGYLFFVVSIRDKELGLASELKVVFNHKSHGSLPARIGVIIFGLGTLIYFLLEILAFFEFESGSPCHYPAVGATSFMAIIFVILQVMLIFLYPRLNLHTINFVDRFGTMHVMATNIIMWLHSLVKESLHEIEEIGHEFNVGHHNESHHPHRQRRGGDEDEDACNLIARRMSILEDLHEDCLPYKTNIIGNLLAKSSPYLYPFVIEFALIGASVIFTMWRHVDRMPLPGHIMSPHATKVHLPRPVAFIRQGSWDHSRKGVIGGVFVLILAILNLGVFFGLDGFTNAEDESEFFSKLTKTVINSFGIISLFIGIWQIQNLDDQELADRTESEMRNLDISLLRFTSFFAYLYHAFTIITGVFNANVKNFPNRIHNINGIVATIQITLQIIFVFDLRRKELPPSKIESKPGRQIAIFMFFHNLAMWLVFTFEIQKVRSSLVEAEFYGIMPWIIIQRVTLPLTIFFRFHSAVVCMEMWKDTYDKRAPSQC